MAISRCNKCGDIAEHAQELVGTTISCKCNATVTVYDTRYFVRKLSDMYFALRKELQTATSTTEAPNQPTQKSDEPAIDIHSSDVFSSQAQHQPIVNWFKSKGVTATPNIGSVDTTGFFDEAAVAIGRDYALLAEICERIRYAQRNEHNTTLIQLDKKSKEEAKAIEAFIQQLYNHSLVARCIINKKDKNIRVVLQNALTVRRFFAGDWLEWFALMTGLRLCQERKVKYACARNMKLSLSANEQRELDVFFLINDSQPLYIECKTGDFRQDIDKYIALSKRLATGQKHFVLCAAEVDSETCKGLTAMHGITFVNTETLAQHLLTIF